MSETESPLRVERFEQVELWTLNRPQARNALSKALVDALASNVERVKDERRLCAVVITGAGEGFCSGADLKERQGMSEDEVRQFLAKLRRTFRSLELSDRVFIAAINGPAFGGGTELALSCDLRVADPKAQLGLTEVALGIIPGGGGTQRLARLIGPGKAKELIFTARRIGASAAKELGLVNAVAEEGKVVEAARALAQEIAKNAPIALGAAKHAINEGLDVGIEEGLEREQQQYQKTLGTKDRLEGLAAFREKRPPRFTGE